MSITDFYMTVEEAAVALGVAERTVFKRIEAGVFQRFKEGDRTFLRRDDVNNYIANLPQK